MNYAIIAAGNGERLTREGLGVPKPMAEITPGTTLLRRLLDIFVSCRAERIRIIINAHTPALKAYVDSLTPHYPLETVCRSTSGSLESLMELQLPADRPWVVTTVDTVFPQSIFSDMVQRFASLKPDAMMGLTPYVDDEKPLYALVNGERVTGYFDYRPEAPDGYRTMVSGGIYGLGPEALGVLAECRRLGLTRMRQYQKLLVDRGLDVRYRAFPCIVDVDHLSDLNQARKLILNQ